MIGWRHAVKLLRWQLHKLARRAPSPPSASATAPADAPLDLAPGEWVRVKSRAEIERLLHEGRSADGLDFIRAPMSRYCGRTLRVLKSLGHNFDEVEEGMRRWERVVLLEGATCDSSQLAHGRCDRACLLFWKESWLERAPAPPESVDLPVRPPHAAPAAGVPAARWAPGTLVRVRSAAEIEATLDATGARDGIPFVGQHMDRYCGHLLTVAGRVQRFYDERDDYFVALEHACTLGGVYCDGAQHGGEPDCDRACALLWHDAWLEAAGIAPRTAHRDSI